MTDLEKWQEFLTEQNIPFEVFDDEGTNMQRLAIDVDDDLVLGYSGFCIDVRFDAGRKVEFGIWE